MSWNVQWKLIWLWEGCNVPSPASARANVAVRLFSVLSLSCFALICAFDITAALQGRKMFCLEYAGEAVTGGKILMEIGGGYAGVRAAAALKRARRRETGQLRGSSATAGVLGGLA